MNRRTFLKWQAGGLAWVSMAALAGPGRLWAEDPAPPDLVMIKGGPEAAARAAVAALGGMGRFVRPGQKVVIKPNMSFALGPERAANTHPEVVRALVLMCREAGAGRIAVLDHPLQSAEAARRLSGIGDICDGIEAGICRQVSALDFYRETDFTSGLKMKKNAVMTEALEADVLIAAPVAKSHGGAGVSLSLKGQMGLVHDRSSFHSRYGLAEAIVDLNTRLKPALTVIDATRVLASHGPGGNGTVLTPGEVIASVDPVAADALAVASFEWYGQRIAPRQVEHIRLAHERGLGRMDIENLIVLRDQV